MIKNFLRFFLILSGLENSLCYAEEKYVRVSIYLNSDNTLNSCMLSHGKNFGRYFPEDQKRVHPQAHTMCSSRNHKEFKKGFMKLRNIRKEVFEESFSFYRKKEKAKRYIYHDNHGMHSYVIKYFENKEVALKKVWILAQKAWKSVRGSRVQMIELNCFFQKVRRV